MANANSLPIMLWLDVGVILPVDEPGTTIIVRKMTLP